MHRSLIGWAAALAAAGCPAARAADWYTGAETPAGPDAWIVAVDTSAAIASQGSQFASATVTAAPAGDLLTSGVRVRVDGLIGSYRAESPGAPRAVGQQADLAAMAGYALVGPDSVLSGFVGLAVRRDEVAQSGLTETVARTGVGLKTALDYYVRPTAFTMFHATGTYSTAFNAYYGRVRFGIAALAGGYVGPEFAALGDDYYRQWRVGAHLSGMQIGAVQLGLSAGYVHDHVRKGGLYTALDMRTGF
ncbi:cellulose biosynthesis protein BcsS [Methylobacterium radiotolerans]|uniref:cellulose biosynthesis protein BcsS n=1 Tax=Methylobacterium radiotolerans TaxID=31998 RepID=UPI001F43A3E2|nr:cellulose biosynthesis protein BcsS [Methylobacterium radiotolerans]UIY41480.1 cellulose biosynthesis protein BcsS [Methylobacterium radiotolerans]